MAYDPNDPEDQKILKKAIDDALEEAVGPLKKKNTELMDELKSAKRGKTIDPAEVEKLESQIDDLQSKITAAEKQAKDAAKALEKAEGQLKAESGFTHKLLVENGLREQLAANGVTNAVHQKAAMALLAGQVQVTAEGDTRVAKVGEKALTDFVKEWAGGDEGKHFVAAPNNSGGGAPGSNGGNGAVKTMSRSAFDALGQADRAAFAKEGGKVVDQAA